MELHNKTNSMKEYNFYMSKYVNANGNRGRIIVTWSHTITRRKHVGYLLIFFFFD